MTDSRKSGSRVALLDDYQAVALTMADWSVLGDNVTVTRFQDHLADTDAIVEQLEGFDVVVPCASGPRSHDRCSSGCRTSACWSPPA